MKGLHTPEEIIKYSKRSKYSCSCKINKKILKKIFNTCINVYLYLCDCLDSTFTASVSSVLRFPFFFFSFFFHVFQGDKFHCSHTVHGTHSHFIQKKIFIMSHTILFTHLKIILLQYFQFSAK